MFGLLGKARGKLEYQTPGRVFFFRTSGLIGMNADIYPSIYRAGYWEVIGEQPDSYALNSPGISEGTTIGTFVFRTLESNSIFFRRMNSTDSMHPSLIDESTLRRNNSNNFILGHSTNPSDFSPLNEVTFNFPRPDVLKFLHIDDSGQAGGLSATDSNMIGPLIGLSQFKNLDRIYISRSMITELTDLPNSVISMELVNISNLSNLLIPEKVKFITLSGSALDTIDIQTTNLEFISWFFDNNTYQIDNFFLNQTNLLELRLGAANNTTGSISFQNTSFTSLDLSNNTQLRGLILDADNKAITYPSDLSNMTFFAIQDDNVLTTTQVENSLTNNLSERFSLVRCTNLSGIGSLNAIDLQNIIRISLQDSGYWNLNLDYSSLSIPALATIYILRTNADNIDIQNTNATDIRIQSLDPVIHTNLNLSDNLNVLTLFLTNINMSTITNDVMADIRQMTSLQNLDIIQNVNNAIQTTISTQIDLTGLDNLRDIFIGNTKTNQDIIFSPNVNNNILRLQIQSEPNLVNIQNFASLNEISNLFIIDNASLNMDFSVSKNFRGSLLFDDNISQVSIDISNWNINAVGMNFRALRCDSLINIDFPSINSNNIIGFLRIIQNNSITTINNLTDLETIGTNNSQFQIEISDNPSLQDLILPFSSTFKIPTSGVDLTNNSLNQISIDTTIDNLYNIRGNTGFGTTVNISGGTNAAPTGIFQAPVGFVLGSSDGTPITANEQIFVLVNNYGLTIITN